MTVNQFFLGLDIGTSGTKAVLFNETGSVCSISSMEYQFYNPQPGWSQIDPDEVWKKVITVIQGCVSKSSVDPGNIIALGLSVLGETIIALDKNGEPLYPAIDSQDKRASGYQNYLKWFQDHFGAENIYARTSYPLSFIAPALRLLWLRDCEPAIFEKMAKFTTFQDFILWKLTGTPMIDYSMASRTLLFDVQQKVWIREFLDEIHLPETKLSQPCLSTNIVGSLREVIAKETGLHSSLLVIAGAHDQSCSALGVGAIREGIVSDGTGSVEAIVTPTRKPFTSSAMQELGFSSESHLSPDFYLALGYHLTAGSLIRWYCDQLGLYEKEIANAKGLSAYDLITASAQKSIPGAHGLLVLPHWSGSGIGHSPMLNHESRGAILGLTLAHTKADLDRSIFEGITFESRLIIETFENEGIPIETIMVTGGGAKSSFWLQLKADIFGKPMNVPETTETSAMGAAMFAAVGSGFYSNFDEVVRNFCRIDAVFEPHIESKAQYDHIFPLYKDLYNAVISINTRLFRLDNVT
jgi:xylulokinase